MSVITQGVEMDLCESRSAGSTYDSEIQHRLEHFGKDGYDVDIHQVAMGCLAPDKSR
jgi:hypothetical protein